MLSRCVPPSTLSIEEHNIRSKCSPLFDDGYPVSILLCRITLSDSVRCIVSYQRDGNASSEGCFTRKTCVMSERRDCSARLQTDLPTIPEQIVRAREVEKALALAQSATALSASHSRPTLLWIERHFDQVNGQDRELQQEEEEVTGAFLDDRALSVEKRLFKDVHSRSRRNKYAALYRRTNWKVYLSEWEEYVESRVNEALQEVIDRNAAWEADGCGLGWPGVELEEMLSHAHIGKRHVDSFVGRTRLRDRALSFLQALDARSGDQGAAGIHLCVTGESGCGKSAFLAQLATDLCDWQSQSQWLGDCAERPVLIRFCSSSRRSADCRSLLASLSSQIELVFSLPRVEVALDEVDAVRHFQRLVAAYPVALFLAGIDTLSDSFTLLTALSHTRLHRRSRIVVSSRRHRSFLSQGTVPLLSLQRDELEDGDGDGDGDLAAMLALMLQRVGRGLSPRQQRYTCSKLGATPTARYLRLVFASCRHWTSDATPHLEHGVVEMAQLLVDEMLARTDHDHVEWMRALLGGLSVCVCALRMEDLQELVALHCAHTAPLRPSPSPDADFWLRARG